MITETTLQSVLASAFDEYSIHERVRTGARNAVYDVTVNGTRAACKTTEHQPGVLAREGAVLRTLDKRTTVRVPTVLATGDGVLLLEWVEGDTDEPDDPPERRRALLSTVGRTMARLHNATRGWFGSHGELKLGDGPLTVDTPVDWPDRLRAFVDGWADDVSTTRYAEVGSAVVETVSTHRELFADCMPALVHGEVSPDHVLMRQDRSRSSTGSSHRLLPGGSTSCGPSATYSDDQ
jgi:fructosamine-3-kinase